MNDIEAMIRDCEQRESKLSDRERDFIDSLQQQMGRGGTITQRQEDWLEKIWERVTSRG